MQFAVKCWTIRVCLFVYSWEVWHGVMGKMSNYFVLWLLAVFEMVSDSQVKSHCGVTSTHTNNPHIFAVCVFVCSCVWVYRVVIFCQRFSANYVGVTKHLACCSKCSEVATCWNSLLNTSKTHGGVKCGEREWTNEREKKDATDIRICGEFSHWFASDTTYATQDFCTMKTLSWLFLSFFSLSLVLFSLSWI